MSAPDEAKREFAQGAWTGLVRLARKGDRRAAEALLGSFSELSGKPHYFDQLGGIPAPLLQYIADCISDWRKRDYQDAPVWFNVDRPNHRPKRPASIARVKALRAYMLLRARGHSAVNARLGAASATGLTDDEIRYLVEGKDSRLHARALAQIHPSLHVRVLNPPRKTNQRSR